MIRKFIKKALSKGKAKKKPSQDSKSSSKRSKRPQKKKTHHRGHAPQSDRRHERKHDHKPKDWSISDFKVPSKKDEVRFHDLDLEDHVMHAIADLGFKYCTPIQAKTLISMNKGENIAGRAQTGTGKTAAFIITILSHCLKNPITHKRKMGTPRALVLAPTRELVMQIEKDARELSKYSRFRSVAVYGGMDYEKQQRKLENAPVDLIAATPGRLIDFKNKRVINLNHVEILVLDEADRMLDMGFIKDLRRIISALPAKDKRRTMLYSATLTEEVMRLASQWMPNPVVVEIDPDQVAVDSVEQLVYAVQAKDKFTLLMNMLKQDDVKKVLIFRNRRDTTEKLFNMLKKRGIRCEMLSGTVAQKKRVRVLDEFRSGVHNVLVATDVAGRGIHVDDITHVINFDFPYEADDYVHRIGRTGRAGLKGHAISFACEDESYVVPDIEKYIGHDLPCKQPPEELLK